MNNLLVCGPHRPGGFDYDHLFQGKTLREETIALPAYRMHVLPGFGYPIIVPGLVEDFVIATFISLQPDHYDSVIAHLDMLEGYFGQGDCRNQHERKNIQVVVGGEEFESAIYIACPTFYFGLSNDTIVPDGDWLEEESRIKNSMSLLG